MKVSDHSSKVAPIPIELPRLGHEWTVGFMSPQQPEQQLSSGAGLMYNFAADDVDAEHKRLTDAGLEVVFPLDDHPLCSQQNFKPVI